MYICVSVKTGKHSEPSETRDEAQAKLVEIQTQARKEGKVSDMIIVEIESLDDLDEFVYY